MGGLTITYRHRGLGAALVAAGYSSGCRVYADGVDPFNMPKLVRHAAFANLDFDVDDEASHPRAAAHLMPGSGRLWHRFLEHRDLVMSEMCKHFFPLMAPGAQR